MSVLWLSTAEAAIRMGVSKRHVRSLCENQVFGFKVGCTYIISASSLQKYILKRNARRRRAGLDKTCPV